MSRAVAQGRFEIATVAPMGASVAMGNGKGWFGGRILESRCLKIRKAVLDDYKSIAKICQIDLGYSCTDVLVKSKLSLIDNERECVFVAEYDNTVIGYVHVEKYDTLYSDTLVNILGLAVCSEKRRVGAGRMLMATAEDWGKEIGAVWVRLNSGSSRTAAHDFYRTLGYNLEKEQIRFMMIL